MHSRHDISHLKQMTASERKIEEMRKLKAAFEHASREGLLRIRKVSILS